MLIINFEGREAKGLSKGRYDETFAGEDASTDDYTTKKTNFFEQFWLFSQLFLVFCKEFMWKMTYMQFTDRIIRYSLYKWHGKENNLARDPICLWLRSLYGY